ncbi:MAG: metalloregulator ArsR/SmtB family transcription factor [Planctomycetota bacterium]
MRNNRRTSAERQPRSSRRTTDSSRRGGGGGKGANGNGNGNGNGDRPSVTERFAVLSETTRLRLLRLLEQSELTVSELATILQMPQSTVSRHLKVLLEGGWVIRRAAGTAGRYQMVIDDLDDAAQELWELARSQFGTPPTVAQDNHRLAETLRARRPDTQAFFGRVGDQWDAMRTELFGQTFGDEAFRGLFDPESIVVDFGCGTGNLTAKIAPHVAVVHAVDQSSAMLQSARRLVIERSFSPRLQQHRQIEAETAEDPAAAPTFDASPEPDGHEIGKNIDEAAAASRTAGSEHAVPSASAGNEESPSDHDIETDDETVEFHEPVIIPAFGPGDAVAESTVHFHQADVLSLPIDSGTADMAIISLLLHHLDSPVQVLEEAARVLRPSRGRVLIIDMLAHSRDEYRYTMGHRWLGFEPARMRGWLHDVGFDRVHLWRLAPDPEARGPDLFAAIGWRSED